MAANSTMVATYLGQWERIMITVILAVVTIVGLVGNALVIAAVVMSRRLHRTTNLFVLSLSLTDLLVCAFLPVQCVAVLSVHDFPVATDALCVAAGFVSVTCLASSINNLVCIALNRYVLIIKARSTYRTIYAMRNTLMMVAIAWVLPVGVTSIPAWTGFVKFGFDPADSSCTWVSAESNSGYSLLLFGLSIPVQITLITWSYARVFKYILRHSRAVAHWGGGRNNRRPVAVETVEKSSTSKEDEGGGRPDNDSHPQLKLHIEVTKNLFVVLVIFLVCVTPFGLSLTLAFFKVAEKAKPFTATLLATNSCLNPIIYGVKHPHFRVVFRCFFKGRFAEIPERVKFCK